MMKIANFVLDEKFIDGQIWFHDTVSGRFKHDYFIVSNKKKPYRFIKKYPNKVRVINENESVKIANEYDAIFLHSLYSFPVSLLPNIRNGVKVFWFAWGFDLYELPVIRPLLKLKLYHKKTLRYIKGDFQSIVFFIAQVVYFLVMKRCRRYVLKAVNRVDFFSGVLPFEYSLIQRQNIPFNAKSVNYSYCNEETVSRFSENHMKKLGANILIGNSTSYTNNHLDIFDTLSKIEIGDRKVVVPLSYSPNPKYVGVLSKEGYKLFGSRFVPLTKFMPYNEYIEIVQDCGFCIFAIERQQAVGNIIASLYNGSKVFFYETSVMYSYFQDIGLLVFNIEKDLVSGEAFLPLNDGEIKRNREIIKTMYKYEVLVDNLNEIYNRID